MNNQSNEGTSRKRRNRTSSEGVAAKKNRQSTEKPKKATPKLGKRELKKPKKKTKRSRRKTTGKRQKICQIFEKALTDSPTLPPIYHLFKTLDPSGTPRASLVEVIRTLQISTIVKDIHFISQDAWKSITNITSLFAIEEDEPGHGLFLKYRPIYNPKKCTVYIDNLPDGCKKEKLQRLACCYGNVADIRINRKGPRMVKGSKKPINVGSREKSFGFIRFVDEDSAKSMIEKFRLNDPSELVENGVRKQGFYDLYAIKLLREIRFLRYRRRRRTLPQIFRLARLRSKLQALRNLNIACRKKKHGSLRRNTWKRNHRDKFLPDPAPSTSSSSSSAPPQPPLPTTPKKPAKFNNPPLPDLTPSPSTSKTKRKSSVPEKHKKNGVVETPKKKNGGLAGNNNKKKRKKRRKLKYGSRKLPNYIPGRSVQQYFERVQCFSMERYEELKAEYLNLVAEEKSKHEQEMENQNNKN